MNNKMRKIFIELEENNSLIYDISYRGGKLGISSRDFVELFFPNKSENYKEKIINFMPLNLGSYCNYLGGGLRGAIGTSDYDVKMPKIVADKIDSFTLACKERYEEIENESSLNEEEDINGETNWEAVGTNKSRKAGVISAY